MSKIFRNYNTLSQFNDESIHPENKICFIKDKGVIYSNGVPYSHSKMHIILDIGDSDNIVDKFNELRKGLLESNLMAARTPHSPICITGYAIDSNPFTFYVYEFEECTVNVYPDSTGYFEITKKDIEEAISKRDLNIHPINTYVNISRNYLFNYLFKNCTHIKTVDLNNVNKWTKDFHKIRGMFYGCTNLVSVDLNQIASYMDPNDDNSMLNTFYKCTSLKEVNFGNYDTSKVITFNSAFFECSSLETLDMSGLNTSSVTNTTQMFSRCTSLKYLDISGWDLSNCTKYSEMFNKCNALKTIRMVGCNQATINLIKKVKKSVSTIVTT